MIQTQGLTKRYGDRLAIDRLDLAVPPGAALGLLGATGAGKSTLLRAFLGVARPTSGRVRVLGHDPAVDPLPVRRETGWIPEARSLYPGMRVAEFVRFSTSFHAEAQADPALAGLAAAGIDGSLRIGSLSRGQRTRVALAAVLARRPRLLLLDEPTEGLDAVATRSTWREIVDRLASLDAGLVLATHRVEDVERVCDRVAILDRGRLLLHADLDDLREAWCRVHLAGPPDPDGPAAWPGVVDREEGDDGTTLIVDAGRGFPTHRLEAMDPGAVRVHPMNLREIYLALLEHGGEKRP